MDGYSVQDAASVLGVPEARVWELIARGVLVGNPEAGGAMRVFLRPAPTSNGSHEVEVNPFRELLTEFRNLTERYGQALLALGEARGEVAALRGRVDLLEARIDLRLPPARPSATVAWEAPERQAAPAPSAEPLPPEPEPAMPEPSPGIEAEFAAEPFEPEFAEPFEPGPPLPDLPGAEDAARAMASLQADVTSAPVEETVEEEEPGPEPLVEPGVADTASMAEFADELPAMEAEAPIAPESVEPSEPPPALSPAEATEAAPPAAAVPVSLEGPYSTEMIEPDWFADGDFSWLEQAQEAGQPEIAEEEVAEPEGDEPAALEPAAAEPAAAEPPADARAQADEPPFSPMTIDMPVSEPPSAAEEPGEPQATAEPEGTAPATPPEPERPAEVTAAEEATGAPGPATPSEPESTPAPAPAEEELMWLGDEFEAAELERPASGWGVGGAQSSESSGELADDQLAGLQTDQGWEPDEVPGMRQFLAGSSQPSADPGAGPDAPSAGPSSGLDQPRPDDPDWLRGRHGNAASAYRRLRRLFP